MLGAVAAGALLGAARGTYTINLDNQEADGGTPGERTDDEYKVVTTEGLEIVIGPSASSVYDIAPALPNPDNGLLLSIAVEGGDNQVPNVAGSCPGGIALDASNGNIFCYGVQRDAVPLVTNPGGSLTVENVENVVAQADFDTWWGASFANCPGDIDIDVIGNKITCYAVDITATDGRGAAVVENTGGTVNEGTITVNTGTGTSADFTSCPGGIVFDRKLDKLYCYGKVVVSGSDERDENTVVVQSNDFTDNSGSITENVSGTNNPTDGFFAICPGDIDLAINGDITCFQEDGVTALVKNEGGGSITVTNGINDPAEIQDITPSSCPGGITLDITSGSPSKIFCYNTARGAALETNIADDGASGSIIVTETSQASQEKTTIAGGTIDTSATITVTGGDALASEGTNYKIELNTDDGAFTRTVTVDDGDGTVTVTETKPDGTVTETITVSEDDVPQSRKTTVTAPDANEDENIVDVTVTVTEETANSNTPYFPGTVTDVKETKTVTVKNNAGDITSKNETVNETTTADSVQTNTVTALEYTGALFAESVEKTKEVTVTVTAPNAEIDDLLSGITGAPDDTFPDSFAAGTVITIVSKSADDSGSLKLETVVVTTELTESGTTTVTEYNIDYSTDEAGILGFIKEIKTEEDESVTTTFFLTGDDSLPNPNGEGVNATAGDYLDLFEEELSSSPTVATYRNRLPAGGKLPESFKNGEEIKGEAILKFEIEGTSNDTLFEDPSRLALTANLTTQVSGGTSRKLLQQEGVTQKETEFRSQIEDDDNIEESLKEVEKDAGGKVIRFSANETKIEEDPNTGFITLTEIETVNGGTEEQVVTENELVLTSIGGSITVVSNKTTVDGQETFCDPPFAIVCGGSGSAPAPSPDNGGGGGGGPAPVPSPDNGG